MRVTDHDLLARVEFGQYKVQATDYYYTLQGRIKGVNMPYAGDPGKDGIQPSTTARDVYAYTVGYYQNDYKPINISVALADTRDKMWTRLQENMRSHRALQRKYRLDGDRPDGYRRCTKVRKRTKGAGYVVSVRSVAPYSKKQKSRQL